MQTNIRMTNDLRDKIRKTLLAKKFDKRKSAIVVARQKLAVQIYQAAFTEHDRARMNRLPAGWLPTVNRVGYRINNDEFFVDFANKREMPAPYEKVGRYSSCPVILAATEKDHAAVVNAHRAIRDEQRAIESEEDALAREINAVLFSVNTANKLITVWPEVSKTVRELCKDYVPGTTLPAPRVDFLNKSLGFAKAA